MASFDSARRAAAEPIRDIRESVLVQRACGQHEDRDSDERADERRKMADARHEQTRRACGADHGAGDRQRQRHAREVKRRRSALADRKARIEPQKALDVGEERALHRFYFRRRVGFVENPNPSARL